MYQSTRLMNTFTHLDKLLNIVLVSTFPLIVLFPILLLLDVNVTIVFFRKNFFASYISGDNIKD